MRIQMTEEPIDNKTQKLVEEALEREIKKLEKKKGAMTDEEKEKFRQQNFSKFLLQVKLKHFVETE